MCTRSRLYRLSGLLVTMALTAWVTVVLPGCDLGTSASKGAPTPTHCPPSVASTPIDPSLVHALLDDDNYVQHVSWLTPITSSESPWNPVSRQPAIYLNCLLVYARSGRPPQKFVAAEVLAQLDVRGLLSEQEQVLHLIERFARLHISAGQPPREEMKRVVDELVRRATCSERTLKELIDNPGAFDTHLSCLRRDPESLSEISRHLLQQLRRADPR